MDGMALDKIAFINNTKDIYVADAVYNGIEGLNVTLYSYRDGREESVSVLFSTHITSDLERIADDIIYLSQGQILAECALPDLTNRYVLIRFESAEQAKNAGAIGIKQVKEGWEGIHFRQSPPSETEIIRKNADLNDIMIHLEIAAREQKIC